MRFRHDVLIERPGCAVAAFALIADLDRLPERFPELPPVRVVVDERGAAGHAVELGPAATALRITVTEVGPGMAIAYQYSNGITQQWRVTDHYDAGCMVTVLAEIPGLSPGQEAEQYREGLLHDLAAIKEIVAPPGE